MTRRSVMNDRYRVERGGKTRKSASAAKPKRAAGEAASAAPKKSVKPKSVIGRATAAGRSRASSPKLLVQTPQMKRLRRIWWGCMGAALALAAAMWYMSANKLGGELAYRVVLVAYVAAIGGALYLEFGPLRRARVEAMATSRGGKKPAKASGKAAKPTAPESGAGDGAETASAAGRGRFGAMVSSMFGKRGTGGEGGSTS